MFGISTTKGCAENKRNDEYVGETASGVSIYGSMEIYMKTILYELWKWIC